VDLEAEVSSALDGPSAKSSERSTVVSLAKESLSLNRNDFCDWDKSEILDKGNSDLCDKDTKLLKHMRGEETFLVVLVVACSLMAHSVLDFKPMEQSGGGSLVVVILLLEWDLRRLKRSFLRHMSSLQRDND
jgi:hypothetical protein